MSTENLSASGHDISSLFGFDPQMQRSLFVVDLFKRCTNVKISAVGKHCANMHESILDVEQNFLRPGRELLAPTRETR